MTFSCNPTNLHDMGSLPSLPEKLKLTLANDAAQGHTAPMGQSKYLNPKSSNPEDFSRDMVHQDTGWDRYCPEELTASSRDVNSEGNCKLRAYRAILEVRRAQGRGWPHRLPSIPAPLEKYLSFVMRGGLPNICCWEYFPSQARALGVSVLEAGSFSKNILAPL